MKIKDITEGLLGGIGKELYKRTVGNDNYDADAKFVQGVQQNIKKQGWGKTPVPTAQASTPTPSPVTAPTGVQVPIGKRLVVIPPSTTQGSTDPRRSGYFKMNNGHWYNAVGNPVNDPTAIAKLEKLSGRGKLEQLPPENNPDSDWEDMASGTNESSN